MSCSSTPDGENFEIAQGAAHIYDILVLGDDDLSLDLTDALIQFVVKARTNDVANLVLKRSAAAGGSDSEIEIRDQVLHKGWVRVKFYTADTTNLIPKTYWYTVWLTLPPVDGPYPIIGRAKFTVEAALHY